MAAQTILAKVPDDLADAVASGAAERIGVLVRDTASKKIIAHLQETQLTQTLAGRFFDAGASALSSTLADPVGGIANVVGIVQNEQIKSRLDRLQTLMGGMQTVQIATLATSFVGIGVSVASTALILSRLKKIQNRFDDLSDQIERQTEAMQDWDVSEVLHRIEASLERVSEASMSKKTTQVIEGEQDRLHDCFVVLCGRLNAITKRNRVDFHGLYECIAALSLCSAAQIQGYAWLDEKERAAMRAKAHVSRMEQLILSLPGDVLATKLGSQEQAVLIQSLLLQINARTATVPSLMKSLASHRVSGRDYLNQASDDIEEPLLMLSAL